MPSIGPTPWSDPQTQKRNFDCYFYKKCLSTASNKKWPGFTCKLCPLCSLATGHSNQLDEEERIYAQRLDYEPLDPLHLVRKERT